MSANGKGIAKIAAIIGAGIALLGSGLLVRLLDVETRVEAAGARDALKVELDGRLNKQDAETTAIGEKVIRLDENVKTIKDDVGYMRQNLDRFMENVGVRPRPARRDR